LKTALKVLKYLNQCHFERRKSRHTSKELSEVLGLGHPYVCFLIRELLKLKILLIDGSKLVKSFYTQRICNKQGYYGKQRRLCSKRTRIFRFNPKWFSDNGGKI